MTDEIPIGRTVRIRDAGLDECRLQDQSVVNPASLQLTDSEVISRERQQASGKRLDVFLKDLEDDSMCEVEVILGDTDESHIIRTIECWDNEKRKWPQRQHHPVLNAEPITRRFSNVIQLLSHAVPSIAVQACLLAADDRRALHFVEVLDAYEEAEEDGGRERAVHDEAYWRGRFR